ncbi:hypothetical protein, partial [Rathayibacter tanaceti]|uniref:hypothetical protein n=1 Tax=Rathayibacter tanaceti TaxID=1671680 RepID=UPI001F249303
MRFWRPALLAAARPVAVAEVLRAPYAGIAAVANRPPTTEKVAKPSARRLSPSSGSARPTCGPRRCSER